MELSNENKFNELNYEQKIRLPLSEKAKMTIETDMLNWNIKSRTSYINKVFNYYKDDAKSSFSIVLQKKEAELRELLSSIDLDKTQKEKLIKKIQEDELDKLKESLDKTTSKKRTKAGTLIRLSNENKDYLESDLCKEAEYYNSQPSRYVHSVIEEYCSLPFIEREAIFHNDHYNNIHHAIQNLQKILVKNNRGQTYYMEPYMIVPDALRTRQYLVGYSGTTLNNTEDKIASVAMSNVSFTKILKQQFKLTNSKRINIEKKLATNSPAYLIGESERIEVELTPAGQAAYRAKLFNRPTKIEELSTEDTYVFDCTEYQAINYFFSMGKDAKIKSPDSLRDRFIEMLRNSLDVYNNTIDLAQ